MQQDTCMHLPIRSGVPLHLLSSYTCMHLPMVIPHKRTLSSVGGETHRTRKFKKSRKGNPCTGSPHAEHHVRETGRPADIGNLSIVTCKSANVKANAGAHETRGHRWTSSPLKVQGCGSATSAPNIRRALHDRRSAPHCIPLFSLYWIHCIPAPRWIHCIPLNEWVQH
jgi:hypothetical protein